MTPLQQLLQRLGLGCCGCGGAGGLLSPEGEQTELGGGLCGRSGSSRGLLPMVLEVELEIGLQLIQDVVNVL